MLLIPAVAWFFTGRLLASYVRHQLASWMSQLRGESSSDRRTISQKKMCVWVGPADTRAFLARDN